MHNHNYLRCDIFRETGTNNCHIYFGIFGDKNKLTRKIYDWNSPTAPEELFDYDHIPF